jgi:hypothetical protein
VFGRRTRIAAAVTAFGLAFPVTAHAVEPGVVSDLNWVGAASEQERIASVQKDMGARWVRLQVSWKDFEQSKGSYNTWNLNHTGNAIRLARESGARVVVMVYDAPAWASGTSGGSGNVPRNPADYADFMRYLASYYRGKVDAYEIWNEQNFVRFWRTGPEAGEYVALLKAAYPAVKAGDPEAKVVFGGLSLSDYRYVEQAYAAGAKGYFDVMAVHPYTYCGTRAPDVVTRAGDGRIDKGSFLAYREVRAAMLARGDDKPLWFTEFGWNTSTKKCDPGAGMWTGGVSAETQAAYLKDALELMAGDAYVQVALWYNFRNNFWANDADEPEARFGLVRTDFSRKPAYYAFKSYSLGSTETPSTTPAASAIQISKVYYNSPGVDSTTNRSLNGEWVRITNTGTTARSLAGWAVRDAAGYAYKFGTFKLGAGKSVRLHTGRGTATATDRYWRKTRHVLGNARDTVALKRADGTVADRCSYAKATASYTVC